MRNILKVTGLMLVLMLAFSTVQAQKFGYINSQEILQDLPELKQAEAELEALQKQLQKKGQGMVEQLQKDYLAIQEKAERGELAPIQQQEEAKKFERGDFSDPAAIHGKEMPGLAELQEANDRFSVHYKELPDGARLVYSSDDSKIVAALHQWFEAQNRDHNGHGNMNH